MTIIQRARDGTITPMYITVENRTWLPVAGLLIGLIIFLIYLPALPGDFFFDDQRAIVTNPAVQQGKLLQLWQEQGTRFIPYLTFAANAQLAPSPLGFRLVNIFIHLANAWLVGYLSLRLWQNIFPESTRSIGYWRVSEAAVVATVSALLFAVHPLATAAVSYIVQRITLLAATAYLGAIILYLEGRWRRKTWLIVTSFLVTCIAMLTKEIAFTLPLMILLADWLVTTGTPEKKSTKMVRWGLFLLPLLIIPLLLFIQRGQSFGIPSDLSSSAPALAAAGPLLSPANYFATQLHVIWTYLRLVAMPTNLNFDYDYPLASSLLTMPTILAGGGLAAIIAVAIGLRKRYRLFSLGVLWFFLALVVESSVLPIEDVIFEHRAYLPLVGSIIASLGIVFRLPRLNYHALITIVFIVVVALSVLTRQRNTVWQNEIALAEDTATKSPGKARVHHSLGDAYVRHGEYENAQKSYEQAIILDPSYAQALNNLGLLAIDRDAVEAENFFRQTIQSEPAFSHAYANLGVALARQGRLPEAEAAYQQALTLQPTLTTAAFNLALLYQRQGKAEQARSLYQAILQHDPEHLPSRQALQAL